MEMQIQLKNVLTQEDIDKVCSLSREIWIKHYSSIIGEEQVKYMLETYHSEQSIKKQIENGFKYYLIEHQTDIAGYLSIQYNSKMSVAILDKIYILKNIEKEGSLKALLISYKRLLKN